MTEVADVLVVGAGPAGASAALAARQADPEADVRLLDLADFPRDKACGDGIAPHTLAELDPHQRRVVVLHHLADLGTAEIAAELGIPEGTVKSRLARGRTRLAQLPTEREGTRHV